MPSFERATVVLADFFEALCSGELTFDEGCYIK
jgi:hypothetical protein